MKICPQLKKMIMIILVVEILKEGQQKVLLSETIFFFLTLEMEWKVLITSVCKALLRFQLLPSKKLI